MGDPFLGGDSGGAFFQSLKQILQVGEDVGVRFVSVFSHQFAVDADVEFAVSAGDEGEGADAVADAAEGVAGHPGGAEGVPSIVAVFNLYGMLAGGRHEAAPQGDIFKPSLSVPAHGGNDAELTVSHWGIKIAQLRNYWEYTG